MEKLKQPGYTKAFNYRIKGLLYAFSEKLSIDIEQGMRVITFVMNNNIASSNSKLSHLFANTEMKYIKKTVFKSKTATWNARVNMRITLMK